MAHASLALLVNWQGRETRIGSRALISFLSMARGISMIVPLCICT